MSIIASVLKNKRDIKHGEELLRKKAINDKKKESLFKVKMYNSKVEMIVNAAKLYAQDNRKEFVNNGNVSVNTLNSKGYLKKDNDSGDIINPIDGSSLKNFSINVSKNNNRYVATINCNDNTWNKNNVLNNDIKSKYCQ